MSLEEGAFAESNVKSVLFAPDSKWRKIGKGVFERCVLEAIDIPSSVETIEEAAFKGCSFEICISPRFKAKTNQFLCFSRLFQVESD